MTTKINELVEAQKVKAVNFVKSFETQSAYNSANNHLSGYLRALVDLGFIENEEKEQITNSFYDDTLGYVKKEG